MTISTAQYTLNLTNPTSIVSPSVMPQFVTLHNMNKSNNRYIYYGSSNVSITNSIHIDPGETVELKLLPLEELYAVSDPADLVVGVIVQKQN